MIGSPAPAPPSRHWVDHACGWAVLVVPLVITLFRLSPTTQWRDDLAVVRAFGLGVAGAEGVISTLAIQLGALLPVGGRLLRASVASAVGLSAATYLLFRWSRALLAENASTPVLGPCLGAGGALMATLGPSWQLEGTVAGGATLGAALAIGAGLLRPKKERFEARQWVAAAALAAASAAESRFAGLCAVTLIAAQAAVLLDLPSRRLVVLASLGALAVLLVLCLPLLVRTWVVDSSVVFGWSAASAKPVAAAGGRPVAAIAWLDDLGLVTLALAALGFVWGLARRALRWLMVPLGMLLILDLALPASRPLLVAEPLMPLRLGALGAVSLAAALGVHTIVLGLRRARIPFVRSIQVLLVVVFFVLVSLAAEDSSYVASRRTRYAADTWTDGALSALPLRSFLLLRSEPLAYRLWAARALRGERPDIVLAPLPLLDRSAFARRLVALEPAALGVVRDVAVRERPSEYALSSLADVRPLMVELDPSYENRVLEHLVPEPFWLGYSAHPLGRSDRAAALGLGRDAFRRVVSVAAAPADRDRPTLAVLGAQCRAQAAALLVLGDRESVRTVLADLKTIDPQSQFLTELERRLAEPRRSLDLRGLVE